jgi:hypothetical protein
MIQKNDRVAGITGNSTSSATSGIGNDTSNKELRIEMNYYF